MMLLRKGKILASSGVPVVLVLMGAERGSHR